MIIPSFEEILEKQKEQARASFGEDFNVSNMSNWTRIIGVPISMLSVELYQNIKGVYDKLSIYTSFGNDLDDLLNNFLFKRKQETKATGQWQTINSIPGTIVNIGALTLERSVDGITYKNTNEVIIDSLGVGLFEIQCETFGKIGNCDGNCVDKIKTPVTGIVSGINPSAIFGGQDKETDLEYLTRYELSNSADSEWNIDGIYSEILKVNGVRSAYVDCNRTNITDSNGWLPHSRIYVVDGGTNQDIAEAIYRKTDRAINENGDVEVNVKDLQNKDRIVKFYRPTNQTVDFRFTLIGISNSTQISTVIKDYIESVRIGGLITATNALESVRQAGLLAGVQSLEIDFSKGGMSAWNKTYQLEYNKKAIGNRV